MDFTDLDVWKKARLYRNKAIKLSKSFPPEEKFRLTDQLVRAVRSIIANIAEGDGRYHYQENIQFCRIARGSLKESLDHLIAAYDDKYITETQLKEMKFDYDELLKLLNSYISYLKKRKLEG